MLTTINQMVDSKKKSFHAVSNMFNGIGFFYEFKLDKSIWLISWME